MDEVTNSKRALDFLREEMNQVDHKIAQLENALDTCDDCLETDGVKAALQNAGSERALLHDLLTRQLSAEAVSLDALLLSEIDSRKRAAQRFAGHWQRGHRTPAAYWNNEVQLAFLNELLSRYLAWVDNRSPRANNAGGNEQPHAYPWYADNDDEKS
jgi:hypothetical protein